MHRIILFRFASFSFEARSNVHLYSNWFTICLFVCCYFFSAHLFLLCVVSSGTTALSCQTGRPTLIHFIRMSKYNTSRLILKISENCWISFGYAAGARTHLKVLQTSRNKYKNRIKLEKKTVCDGSNRNGTQTNKQNKMHAHYHYTIMFNQLHSRGFSIRIACWVIILFLFFFCSYFVWTYAWFNNNWCVRLMCVWILYKHYSVKKKMRKKDQFSHFFSNYLDNSFYNVS